MVCIQKVKREDSLRTENRSRIPTNPQQLPEVVEESVLRALAEADGDGMVTGKINHKQPLGLPRGRTKAPGVSQIYDKTKTLEGYTLEKPVGPDLKFKSVEDFWEDSDSWHT